MHGIEVVEGIAAMVASRPRKLSIEFRLQSLRPVAHDGRIHVMRGEIFFDDNVVPPMVNGLADGNPMIAGTVQCAPCLEGDQ